MYFHQIVCVEFIYDSHGQTFLFILYIIDIFLYILKGFKEEICVLSTCLYIYILIYLHL